VRRAGILLLLAVAAISQVVLETAVAGCTKPHHHPIGTGPIPSGGSWSVTAGIKNNGGCESWLFTLDFSLGPFGSAGTGTGIPPGGHVPREYFRLSADDLLSDDGSERVFYGYAGNEAARVVATLRSGKRFTVLPRLAPAPLRKRVAWLRSFRFFVYFHPNEGAIDQVSVFTRGGRLIYRTKSFGGSFFEGRSL